MKSIEFEAAVSRLIDNDISAQDFEELQEHLRVSDDAQQRYAELMRLHSLLQEATCDHSQMGEKDHLLIDHIVAAEKRRSIRIAALSTVAILALGVVILMFTILPNDPASKFATSPGADFVLTHPAGADGEAGKADVLREGSRLQLTSGVLELNLGNGVHGIIRAPADITIQTNELVSMAHGTAWFEVPKNAIGFQVKTPEFLLTDLGTKFGIISAEDKQDQVHVFSGRVDVKHHLGAGSTVAVKAGEALKSENAGGWEKIVLAADLFLTDLPDEMVLPPHLYWSFDRSNDRHVAGVAGDHPSKDLIKTSSQPKRNGPKRVPGRVGQALSFDGRNDWLKTDWMGISGDLPRSVAFWVKIPPIPVTSKGEPSGYSAAILRWGKWDKASNQNWSVRLSNRGVRLSLGKNRFDASAQLADGKWHHVAIVCDARNHLKPVQIYIDGQADSSITRSGGELSPAIDTATSGAGADRLSIGKTMISASHGYFRGELDELYIFEGALSSEMVCELANP